MDHPHIPDIPHNPRGTRDHGCDCDRSYDPLDHGHRHPGHPPFFVDKCADQCDDQLPLFSQVGRGLRGDGYRVDVAKDGLVETILEGMTYDAHTGAFSSDWFSENINGGHLYYAYNLRQWTDPQTFTITFRYVRPGRNADEEGTVWSWTSPAIPYVGDETMGDTIASWVSTLYLRKKGEAWNVRKHEKLTYPEGITHDSVNAPDPEEGWTVNLTYGIDDDCDIVVPTVEDLAKIIGMSVTNIYNIVEGSLPTNVIPDGMNVKQYIDSLQKTVDVTSKKPGRLSVAKTETGGGYRYELDPKLPVAGPGIAVSEDDNGNTKISSRIQAGAGIGIRNQGGVLIVENTIVSPPWKTLVAGQDYDFTWRNGWYGGPGEAGSNNTPMTNPQVKNPPVIQIVETTDASGNIVGALVRIFGRDNSKFVNSKPLSDPNNFLFRHSDELADVPKSAIVSFSFIGDYAVLNGKSVVNNETQGSGLWGVLGTDDSWNSGTPNWSNVRGVWPVTCMVQSADGTGFGNGFVLSAVQISDGWNNQYTPDQYGKENICIRSWANIDIRFTIQ